MSKKHTGPNHFHGHKGCGCQSAILSESIREADKDPSRRELLQGAGALGGLLVFGGLLGEANAKMPALPSDAVADTIYHGGPILTMAGESEQVEAVAVFNGRILAAGDLAQVMARKGPETQVIDLAGKTLLPGFVDAHSHIAGYELFWGTPDLSPPPVSDVTSIAQIQAKMRAYIVEKRIPEGNMVFASGYDDALITEKRHPTRQELDEISTKHPVVAMHTSQHQIIANSAALKLFGYDRNTPDPQGGLIRRDADGELTGQLEELAMMPLLKFLPKRSMDEKVKNLVEIQQLYASFGITTAQDGMTMPDQFDLLREAQKREALLIDVVAYPRWQFLDDYLDGKRKLNVDYTFPGQSCEQQIVLPEQESSEARLKESDKLKVGVYENRLKFGGVKITADGAVQGYTAYLSKPYFNPPKALGFKEGYRAYQQIKQERLDKWFDAAYRDDIQILVHCNGDAAVEQMIEAVRKAQAKYGKKDLRPVMVHAQTARHDQVDAMAELGITPSFFPVHTFIYGDTHINHTLGEERAFRISPSAYAKSKGIPFTIHTDAPVVPPNTLFLIWTAVNRLSRSNVIVGPDERISPMDALKAITIDSARQYIEEKSKGSIEVGKLADLVILDKDPLKVDPLKIKDIKVVETIKEGRTIYRA